MRFFSFRFANSNMKLSRSNSSASEFKTSMIEIKKLTLEIEINLSNELSISSSTSKQLQNNIVDLFCSQQKSLTSVNRKMQYMFSSLDALMLNSHANVHNDKNTINLQSIMRFICTRCWLWIFCKLCLSKELNNFINIDRAVTALYSHVEFTHSWKARQ